MRIVPTEMTDAWLAVDKTGERRPTCRATIQYVTTAAFPYDDIDDDERPRGSFQSILFGQPSPIMELPGISRISWSRGVTQDVAECTLTLQSSQLVGIGEPAPSDDYYDDPGYLADSRGGNTDNHFAFDTNGWEDLIIPDRLVRTYEGYGTDTSVWPADDTNLKATGVWLIDEVTQNDNGQVELKMRDIGRILIDQISFPNYGIPYNHYPMQWSTRKNATRKVNTPSGGTWRRPAGTAFANGSYYVGKTITTSDGSLYVASDGVWSGNKPIYALNPDPTKVWISTGHEVRDTDGPKAWWQVNLANPTTSIAGLRINSVGGPMVCYVSLFDSVQNKWIGRRKIPETAAKRTAGVDTSVNIPFVTGQVLTRDVATDVILPKVYKNVSKVRLTFRMTAPIGSDDYHPYRAGLREVFIYSAQTTFRGGRYTSPLRVTKASQTYVQGNVDDYTDPIRWILAWAGFYWPPHATSADYQLTDGSGTRTTISYTTGNDPVIHTGRVWGDFMDAGTSPIADLTPDLFDKQPLMDAISYIRDVLGFIAFVDETGGYIWRMPNIWTAGNYLSPDDLDPRSRTRTTDYVTIDGETQIQSYTTTKSSKNLREAILVGNTDGHYATLVGGYGQTNGVDLRRVAGYLDQHFDSQPEVEQMADMIATRQKFSYRTGNATIPGYPAIQIDDQIKIYERTTNETYFHYVESINSEMDLLNGTWTYNIGTHWLGESADGSWVINATSITSDLNKFLTQLGVI